MQKHIAVIGGGAAGTAAAYRLRQHGYRVTILEREARLGGRIRSTTMGGLDVEIGAGFVSNSYKNVLAFLDETGLRDHLYSPQGPRGVMRGGRIRFSTSGQRDAGVLPLSAKLRAVSLLLKSTLIAPFAGPHTPWRAAHYDTRSVADELRGSLLLDRVAQPILNGYFYWRPEEVSRGVLPVIGKALLKGGNYKMRGGLSQIPARAAEGCKVLLGAAVRRVEQNPDGGYVIAYKHGGKVVRLAVDGVVCATTATVVPTIIPGLNDQQHEFFKAVRYSATALVTRLYEGVDAHPASIAVPRTENLHISAVTIAPFDHKAVVKMYASGEVREWLHSTPDAQVKAMLSTDATPVIEELVGGGVAAKRRLWRWPEALPIPEVGHFKLLRDFRQGKIETDTPLTFAGDYLGGPFIEGAFTSGLEAADRLDQRLHSN